MAKTKGECLSLYGDPGRCEQPTRIPLATGTKDTNATQGTRVSRDTIRKQSRDIPLVYARIRMGNNFGDKSNGVKGDSEKDLSADDGRVSHLSAHMRCTDLEEKSKKKRLLKGLKFGIDRNKSW